MMEGIVKFDSPSGIFVIELSYRADPAKRTPEWEREARQGLSDRAFRQEYGLDWTVASGLPVFGDDFVREWHVAKEPLKYLADRPMIRGWDFGLQPACIFCQTDAMGRLNVLYEMVTWDGTGEVIQQGIETFAPAVVQESAALFGQASDWLDFADPSGWSKSQTDEKSCVDIMRQAGIYPARGPVTFTLRRRAVVARLQSAIGGRPSLLISPRCHMIIQGMAGAYRYEQIGETRRYREVPEKNAWSHPVDALTYVIGALYTPRPREKDIDVDEVKRRPRKDKVTGY